MKKLFILLVVLLASLGQAEAHQQPPFSDYLASPATQTIYLAKVLSVEKDKVTFAVEEAWRGASVPILTLSIYPSGESYTLKSEWLLASCTPHGWSKTSVGWALKGDCAWIPASITQKNGQSIVSGIGTLQKARKIVQDAIAKN